MSKLKTFNPVTPSLRGTILLKQEKQKAGYKPYKKLLVGKKSTGGRCNNGRITTRFRGGGNKISYRIIAFKKKYFEMPAEVIAIEYDPNRTANIALIKYENGEHEYIIATEGLAVGDKVMNSRNIQNVPSLKTGNSLVLSEIPIGTQICCVELKPGHGAQLARSAGAFVTLSGKENGKIILKMPSRETRVVQAECMATLGVVSNVQHQNTKIGKAGRNRWKGKRPHVRGETMNPVDHPLGGRTRGGKHPVSPWGQCAKGLKTRTRKYTNVFILSRRKKKVKSN